MPRRLYATVVVSLGLAGPLFAAEAKPPSPQAVEHFEKTVRPILAEHCQSCHGAKKQQGGLRLDTAAGLAKGTDLGSVVVPGNPEASKLVASVRRKGDNAMPPDSELTNEQVAALVEWVKQGAVFPASAAADPADAKKHWAFQPVKPSRRFPRSPGIEEPHRCIRALPSSTKKG